MDGGPHVGEHIRVFTGIQEVVIAGDWAYCWTQLSVIVIPRSSGAAMRRSGPTLTVVS